MCCSGIISSTMLSRLSIASILHLASSMYGAKPCSMMLFLVTGCSVGDFSIALSAPAALCSSSAFERLESLELDDDELNDEVGEGLCLAEGCLK